MQTTPQKPSFHPSKGEMYEIHIQGVLDEHWTGWFEGMQMRVCGNISILRGSVPDQAALHGILASIRDLNLKIISVELLTDEAAASETEKE